jgi:hypothetical protein
MELCNELSRFHTYSVPLQVQNRKTSTQRYQDRTLVPVSPTDVLTVTYREYNHFSALVFDIAADAVISDPVTPKALRVSMEGLPKLPGIRGWPYALSEIVENVSLRLPTQLAHVFFGGPGELDVPVQAAAPALPS